LTLYYNTPQCQAILDHAKGDIILLEAGRKKPVDNQWVTADPNINGDGRAYFDLGYNLGFRIPKTHLVIDVDPRNGGTESFMALPQEVQDLPITTITASGGFHIYTLLPDGYDYNTLRTKIDPELKGIDFLHYGKQVVLPGSMLNETAGWQLSPSFVFPPPATPLSLLEILKKTMPVDQVVDLKSYLSELELDTILSMIPVERYRDNDSWLRLAMACHHATDGVGLPVFLAWSVADSMYSDQGEIITRRWESMDTGNTPAPVTIRTLIRELAACGPVPSWLLARAQMKSSPADFFGELDEKNDGVRDAFETIAGQIDACGDHMTLLTTMASRIGLESLITESMREILIKKIAIKTGTSVSAIRKDIKLMVTPALKTFADAGGEEEEDEAIEAVGQPHTQAAQTAIAAMSDDGVPPAFCFGDWLKWNGQYWSRWGTNVEVKREAHKALYNQGTHATKSAVESVVGIMQTLMEVPTQAFEPRVNEISIYTPLHVLRFSQGTWNVSRPSPENRNLNIIGAVYDKDAPEPTLWLKFLNEVTTSPEAQKTIACSIVYSAAQCRPWLRKAIYLYGPKRSGKSTMLNAVQDLLGGDNCSALNMRQLGGKFGAASLVGKLANISNETLSKDVIQDDIFKSLISGEAIETRQIYQAMFMFHNTAKLWFAANGFPRVNDESDATWDRLTIISCPTSVNNQRNDPQLGGKLKKELSGILLWALNIFKEEYNKDTCLSAMDMDDEAKIVMRRWREVNNPALRWKSERLIVKSGDSLSIKDAYADYRQWCRNNGHKELNLNHFSRQVGQDLHRTSIRGAKLFVNVGLAPAATEHFSVLD
jgi:P4 family phage/plasmid primase-like protien